MKFVTGLLATVLLLAGIGASHAVVRIADDRGGRIGTYVNRYQGLRSSGESVVIDGLCASACTIVLGAVPYDKICVTSHANAGFPCGVGFRQQWPDYHQSRSDPYAVFDVSDAGAALDCCARRVDASHDLPARQGVAGDVQALLSRRRPLFRCRRIGPSSLIRSTAPRTQEE